MVVMIVSLRVEGAEGGHQKIGLGGYPAVSRIVLKVGMRSVCDTCRNPPDGRNGCRIEAR